MAAIRAAKLSLPDSVDKPMAQILRKALAPDMAVRYRTAGEFAGALLTWALDSGQQPLATAREGVAAQDAELRRPVARFTEA